MSDKHNDDTPGIVLAVLLGTLLAVAVVLFWIWAVS
jgi:hypothetical protein